MIKSPLVADKSRTPANRPAGLPPGASAGFFVRWYNAAMLAFYLTGLDFAIVMFAMMMLWDALSKRPPPNRQ
jgi:hypothetical protein